MKIDLKELARSLADAEGTPTFRFPEVSDYVLKHIYEPLSREKPVLFVELDFNAFDESDLNALEGWVNAQCNAYDHLCNLNGYFSNAAPVSVTARAFC